MEEDNEEYEEESEEETDEVKEEIEESEQIKEIPSATLEELTQQIPQENIVEASEFFETPLNGEFVAPILDSDIGAESLEEATQNAPVAAPTSATATNFTIPGIATPTSTSDYSPSSTIQDYSEYESEAYRLEREEAGREETRFDPTRGLFADTAEITSPVINPFTRRQETTSIRDELEQFAEEQRKYREEIEEDRPPFLRGRKKTKVF